MHEKCNKEARLELRILDHFLMVTQIVTLLLYFPVTGYNQQIMSTKFARLWFP